jgi:hypothetical protein
MYYTFNVSVHSRVAEENYQFAYFFRKVEPHSVLVKVRRPLI